MDSECSVNEVEQQLKEAGEQLVLPPSSTKDLLDLLDKIEQLLTFVGQEPPISMQGALVPSMGALISDELLKHSDLEVKVSVASCLSEIARITAPDQPYKDQIMKEIFKLNVIAFGEVSNVTSRNYRKAIHILECVAKVKSCLLMLDLECDDLVNEMFDQFLSKIRSNYPHNVFSDMEKIMTLVIEESDEIAPDLLSLLISHVRKENQNISPASWNLAEKVLRNCDDTLKSYSETIKKLINSDLDYYSEVVTFLCQNANKNDFMVTKSTKRGLQLNIMENGGSKKKQKYINNEQETVKRGRPKKNKNNLNQDISPNSNQNSRDNRKQLTKSKGNIDSSDSLYNVKIENENSILLSDYDGPEPLMQEINNNNKVQNERKTSSRKRVANGSRGKFLTQENMKEWGQDLVGRKIKVWWPLDKMFYDGAVSFYDPVEDKYKVLYADGDEETLDLNNEKWKMRDEKSPNQQREQVVADLQTPMTTTSSKRIKKMAKRKVESTQMEENNSNSSKSPTPADSSKTESSKGANTSYTIVPYDNQKDDLVQTTEISYEINLAEKTFFSEINLAEKTVSSEVNLAEKTGSSEINFAEKTIIPPSGELEEMRLQPESNGMTQKLEENELGCEISDHITA